jgi:hypothetical protein
MKTNSLSIGDVSIRHVSLISYRHNIIYTGISSFDYSRLFRRHDEACDHANNIRLP